MPANPSHRTEDGRSGRLDRTYAGPIPGSDSGSDSSAAALARARGAPLLEALCGRLPHARERAGIAATLAAAIAAETGAPAGEEAELLAEAARLQEVGKLYVPAGLLAAGASPPEAVGGPELERHYAHGHALMRGAGLPARACTWVLHAREQWNGGGPTGLTAEEIPYGSRVLAATREYLDAPLLGEPAASEPREQGRRRLLRLAGSVLDPEIARVAADLVARES